MAESKSAALTGLGEEGINEKPPGDAMRTKSGGLYLERVARIELANKPWQGFRLPLHHTRIKLFKDISKRFTEIWFSVSKATQIFQICSFSLA